MPGTKLAADESTALDYTLQNPKASMIESTKAKSSTSTKKKVNEIYTIANRDTNTGTNTTLLTTKNKIKKKKNTSYISPQSVLNNFYTASAVTEMIANVTTVPALGLSLICLLNPILKIPTFSLVSSALVGVFLGTFFSSLAMTKIAKILEKQVNKPENKDKKYDKYTFLDDNYAVLLLALATGATMLGYCALLMTPASVFGLIVASCFMGGLALGFTIGAISTGIAYYITPVTWGGKEFEEEGELETTTYVFDESKECLPGQEYTYQAGKWFNSIAVTEETKLPQDMKQAASAFIEKFGRIEIKNAPELVSASHTSYNPIEKETAKTTTYQPNVQVGAPTNDIPLLAPPPSCEIPVKNFTISAVPDNVDFTTEIAKMSI